MIIKARDLPAHARALIANGGTGLRKIVVKKRARQWGTGTLLKRKNWLAEMGRGPGVFIEMRTKPEGNNRQHWWKDQRRIQSERLIVTTYLLGAAWPKSITRYVLTRYSVRPLDEHDNLRSSLKHVVDAIAKYCGRDNDGPPFKWEYRQEHCPPSCFGVRIEMEVL